MSPACHPSQHSQRHSTSAQPGAPLTPGSPGCRSQPGPLLREQIHQLFPSLLTTPNCACRTMQQSPRASNPPLLGEELRRSCRKSIAQVLSCHRCADKGRESWVGSGPWRETSEPPVEVRQWAGASLLCPRGWLGHAAEDMPFCQSWETQCAADHVRLLPGLRARGSPAGVPAPPQTRDALGHSLATHCHQSTSGQKWGSSRLESPAEMSLLGWKCNKRKLWPEGFDESVALLREISK